MHATSKRFSSSLIGSVLVLILALSVLGATNPVPFVNQPLVPAAAVPGGPAFTLTVNGTGFASGAVVNWNGSPRTTTFVSSMQLTASILASDIATAGIVPVTVTNPGGATSQSVPFEVTSPTSAVSFTVVGTIPSVGTCDTHLAVGVPPFMTADFNGDGKTDIVTCNSQGLIILLSNGDGTFRQLSPIPLTQGVTPCLVADVNQDGKLDLILCGGGPWQLLLGNGDGTFQPALTTTVPLDPISHAVAGDFNRDGHVDLAFATGFTGQNVEDGVAIVLGNGNGTFQSPIVYPDEYEGMTGMVEGDFDRNGTLDLATTFQNLFESGLEIFFGKGDGSFQNPIIVGGEGLNVFQSADVNGDGILDLITSGGVLPGKGNGTFGNFINFPTGTQATFAADMNGDGILDVAGPYVAGVSGPSGVDVSLGNGDGTFQSPQNFEMVPGYLSTFAGMGDFNGDGRLDMLTLNNGTFTILLQTTAELPLVPVQFGNQETGTTSPPQNVTLTNVGASTLNISSIALKGAYPGDFVIESNGCGTSLAAGASCTVSVAFAPMGKGSLIAALTFTDDAVGSPQSVTLTGTGVYTGPPAVTLTPTSVAFPAQLVNTTSASVPIMVMNTGGQTLIVNGVIFNGADATDFADTSDCGNVGSGASCTISVTFTPPSTGTFTATMEIIDNAPNSPQTVPVSGTGTNTALSGLTLSPTSLTLSAGQSGSFTATVTPAGGAGSVTFSCSAAPPAASCLPGTPVLNSNGTLTSTIKITTTAASVVPDWPGSRPKPVGFPPLVILLLGLACGLVAFLFASWLRPAWSLSQWMGCSALLVLLMAVSFMAACGGGGGGGQAGTPPGTYMLTVTASASGQSQSSTFMLTVK
jgi:hypothetical protein